MIIDFISPPAVVWLGLLLPLAMVIISWRSTIGGLYLLTALLPTYLIRLRLWDIPTTILELSLLLLFIVWLLRSGWWQQLTKGFLRPVNLVPPTVRWLLIILLLAATVSAVISPQHTAAWGIWKAYWLEPIMIFLLAIYTIRTRRQIEILLKILGWLVLALFPLGLIQYLTGCGIPREFWANADTRRITTIYGYPNGASLLLGPIVALFLGWRFQI